MLTDDRLRELWKANGQPGTVWRDWAERFARAVEAEARREALEEALRSLPECGVGHYRYEQALKDCAAAIRALTAPRFANVSCSQCGREFGPGDHGYSHCKDHAHLRALP